jgi:16S rRNA (guanine966-N2)-methyltransferase
VRDVRIVAGRHKRKPLSAPKGLRVRPTSERAREALFDILVHGRFTEDGASVLVGARVLDAFAGTGALGFEALSRGAAHATFMDTDAAALEAARANAERLGEAGRAMVMRADAVHPPAASAPCAIVFLDPPYGSGRAGPGLAALEERGWLADRALAAVEVGARESFDPPHRFEVLDERRFGAARIIILRRQART